MTREEKIAEIRRLRALKQQAPAAVAAPEETGPSKLESLLRGGAQGALLGFADEATGMGEAALNPSTYSGVDEALANYTKSRDESRANYKAAEEANPNTYMAGNVGGGVATSLIPILGAGKGVATLGSLIGTGAKVGGLAGLGESKADLTQGEVGQAAKDTALGAGIGAATSGIIGGAVEGGKSLLDYAGKKQFGRDFGDIARAYRNGETLTGESVLHDINTKSKNIASKVIDDAQSQKSTIGNEYQNFFRTTPLDDPAQTKSALKLLKDELVQNSTNPVIREQRNGLIKYLDAELANPNMDARRLKQIKDEVEAISADAFKGGNEQFMSRFNTLMESANPNYFSKLQPINDKYTNFMELLGGLKSSTGENYSTALNKDAAAKESLVQAFKKSGDVGGQTYNKLNRLSGQSNVLSQNMQQIQELARKGELNKALSEGKGGVDGLLKGITLDTAPVLGTVMNKIDKAANAIGLDSALGQKLKGYMSSPENANKMYFMLNQQPWFRNLIKDDEEK